MSETREQREEKAGDRLAKLLEEGQLDRATQLLQHEAQTHSKKFINQVIADADSAIKAYNQSGHSADSISSIGKDQTGLPYVAIVDASNQAVQDVSLTFKTRQKQVMPVVPQNEVGEMPPQPGMNGQPAQPGEQD